MGRFRRLGLFAAVVWWLVSIPGWAGQDLRAVEMKVVDGDSLEVQVGAEMVQVRLHGIDSPEWDQPHGPEASGYLRELAEGQTVTLVPRDRDGFDRLVAEVLLRDGRSVNRELVRAGHAWWYRRYSAAPEPKDLEARARAARRGLWKSSDPVPPWLWRRDHSRR